jgi:ABC-type glutathione transport system ATPase component
MPATMRCAQVCALVGESGSGKSTVVALLQRFYGKQPRVMTTLCITCRCCTANVLTQRPRATSFVKCFLHKRMATFTCMVHVVQARQRTTCLNAPSNWPQLID